MAARRFVLTQEQTTDPRTVARWQGVGIGLGAAWLLWGDGLGGLARWVAALVTGGP